MISLLVVLVLLIAWVALAGLAVREWNRSPYP